ncbi:GNAT family N-acetyltransferase [Chitinophaga pendula]|uniref:GNAT family N-acetyltransferase n=1 Tax=Chitinophaga TaxID=79328 RepID=UPI000BAEE82F|nr:MULTISPECIES: GNAT family N-acetyltransferase [Chitinophaga]ASZ10039.1 GNAT family N-acetyltransferase [Chitinophaga sp. MD30]UCJ07011.1 GNAT family N-acetyltransferase [Chitinophaga pendula]
MTDIRIIPFQLSLLDTLVTLERTTFQETFPGLYTEQDLHAFLEEKKSAAALQREAAHPDTRYYLLYYGEEVAGYLKLNLYQQPYDGTKLSGPVMQLEKIYVLHAFHGHKLGKALMQKAYEVAAAYGIQSIWLSVWENNLKAQGFYTKEGFSKFGDYNFPVGQHIDHDWLLQKSMA